MARSVIINNEVFKTYFTKRRKGGLPGKKAVLATVHEFMQVHTPLLVNHTYFEPGKGNKYI